MQTKCIFCEIPVSAWLLENEHYYVIHDQSPVSQGHCLIVSKRHVKDFFDLSELEAAALLDISKSVKIWLMQEYCPVAFNLVMNCGSGAGQSVFHYHLHVIPRY